jgi:hypothetical protein
MRHPTADQTVDDRPPELYMSALSDTELYHRGTETLLASWERHARGARDAAVNRFAGVVVTAIFPTEPERSVYNNAPQVRSHLRPSARPRRTSDRARPGPGVPEKRDAQPLRSSRRALLAGARGARLRAPQVGPVPRTGSVPHASLRRLGCGPVAKCSVGEPNARCISRKSGPPPRGASSISLSAESNNETSRSWKICLTALRTQ